MSKRHRSKSQNPNALSDEQQQSATSGRWPKGVVELLDVATYALRDEFGESKARELAAKVIDGMAFYMGGRQFYLPRGKPLRDFIRNLKIWRDHSNGVHINDLAATHNLSCVRIHQILRQQRAIHKAED